MNQYGSESDLVDAMLQRIGNIEQVGRRKSNLIYHQPTGAIRDRQPYDRMEDITELTEKDFGRGQRKGQPYGGLPPTVVVTEGVLRNSLRRGSSPRASFAERDGGRVYTSLGGAHILKDVAGSITYRSNLKVCDPARLGRPHDRVRILITPDPSGQGNLNSGVGTETSMLASAYIRVSGKWKEAKLIIIPSEDGLFARNKGLLENGALRDRNVLLIGLGSIGAPVAVQLAQAGVGGLDIVDMDFLEPHNMARHPSPLSDCGRLKVDSVADLCWQKNPYMRIRKYAMKVGFNTYDQVNELVRRNDLTVGGADTHDARTVMNIACVKEGKVCYMAGFKRRAHAGQVLVIRPGIGPCYQCYVTASPGDIAEYETTDPSRRDGVAYTDRPNEEPEPGLVSDIAPFPALITKLAMMELLRGKETSLSTLYEDFEAPLYLWVNRRDPDSKFARLEPLGYGVGGLKVLRWYGLPLVRDPMCPVCGDYLGGMAEAAGVEVTEEDLEAFQLQATQ